MANEANIDSMPESRRLYSVAQIAFAAWAASPLAGCLLLNFNYRALQKPRAAWQALVLGFLATVLVFAIPPHRLPRMTLPLASAATMWPLALYLQGNATRNHFAFGGRKGSWWTTVGLSFLIVLSLLVVLFVGLMLYQHLRCYYECRWLFDPDQQIVGRERRKVFVTNLVAQSA